jgi:hypothetical protein
MYWVVQVAARILMLLLVACPVLAKCSLVSVAQFPIDMQTNRFLVAAAINGHATRMLIDTGSPTSIIYRSAAQTFGLEIGKTDSPKRNRWNWVENAKDAQVRDLDISGLVVHNVTFAVMGEDEAPDAGSGVLGEDFLTHWDEEFDPAAGVLRLIRPDGCKGDQVAYWTQAYSVVKLTPAWGDAIESDVLLNEHAVRASFDTGISFTTVASEVSKRPGFHPTNESDYVKAAQGIGEHKIAVFSSITIGQETIHHPELYVANLPTTMIYPDMRIGADFFHYHHVYIARGQGKMYFTYLGGPVFARAMNANAAAAGHDSSSPMQPPPPTTAPDATSH